MTQLQFDSQKAAINQENALPITYELRCVTTAVIAAYPNFSLIARCWDSFVILTLVVACRIRQQPVDKTIKWTVLHKVGALSRDNLEEQEITESAAAWLSTFHSIQSCPNDYVDSC